MSRFQKDTLTINPSSGVKSCSRNLGNIEPLMYLKEQTKDKLTDLLDKGPRQENQMK